MEVKPLNSYKISQSYSAESLVKTYFEHSESSTPTSSLQFLKDSSNLLTCEEKSEAGILKSLNKRISFGVPYTSVGKDLIAVNCDFPGNWYFNTEVKSNNLKSKPHPYNISLNAYIKLKETRENQVITMLGVCGSGKTFNAIHVLDHLIKISTEDFLPADDLCLDLFENLHRSIQLLHIMGSVCKKRNLESTTCALDVCLKFDQEFKCTGGAVHASLLDISLPTPKKGRTYQILHSIMHCDPNTLKILGLSPKLPHKVFGGVESDLDFQIFDTEVNQRFFECLGFLDVTLSEKKSFLEVLTCVINLYEIEFVRKGQSIEPKNRWVLRKVCKSLGMTENGFLEKFAAFGKSEDCELRCRDLGRYLYSKAFDWLSSKVSQRLRRVSDHIQSQRKLFSSSSSSSSHNTETPVTFSINILDFPGFNKEKTLGGLIKNLAFESLNYYSSSNYLKLLDHLSKQKVTMAGLKDCKAKQVVEFFMNGNSVLFSLFAHEKEFNSTWARLKSDPLPEIFSFVSGETFAVHYTNGSVTYNLQTLRSQATQHFFNDFNSNFLKSCNVEILSKKQIVVKIEEVFTASLRKVLLPYLNISPWIIYCLKSEVRGVDRKSLEFLRNSTVFPNLVWNWFGFPHWIKVQDVARELGLSKAATLLQVKLELQKKFHWKDVQTCENFVMLKSGQMNELKAFIGKQGKTPENAVSDLSMSLSLFSLTGEQEFGFTVHEDSMQGKQATRATVIGNSFTFVDIEKTFEDSETLTQSTTNDKYSLNGSFNDSVIIVKGGNTSKPRVFRTVNYSKIDYSGCVGDIVYIQKIWRGQRDRQYVKALKNLNDKAKLIQALWKGFLVRKTFGPVLVYQKAAFVIQKYWKLYVIRKKMAVRVLQRWYRKIKGYQFLRPGQSSNTSSYPSSKRIVEDSLEKHNRKLKKKIDKKIRSSKSPKMLDGTKAALNNLRSKNLEKNQFNTSFERHSETDQSKHHKNSNPKTIHQEKPSIPSSDLNNSRSSYSSYSDSKAIQCRTPNPKVKKSSEFIPKVSQTSKKLAQKKMSQFSDLSIVDRFKILEANRIEKIHKKRQEKLELETFSHIPTVHKNDNIRNSFEQRQELYLKNAKSKLEQINKFVVKEEFSFSPNIKKDGRSRSPDQTVEDLYKWARMKEKRISQARDSKIGEESRLMEGYKLGETSLAYSMIKKYKVEEGKAVTERVRRDNSPYWPNNDS